MSIYQQANSACSSPINLSQSAAKECHLTCDLVFDDGMVTEGRVYASNEGLVLSPSTRGYLGSCKFNGDGYNCVALLINHPSQHTIEGVQTDGEVIAIFQNATGDILCVSSLFRVNSTQNPFFRAFVSYADPNQATQVPLNNWGVYQMVPSHGAYFFYEGTTVDMCQPCKWVVFQSPIIMDQSDFAALIKNVQAGSRSIQPLGDREIFFNDREQLGGGPMPHDNKTYIRCRPSGKKRAPTQPVSKVDLKTTAAKEREESSAEPTSTTGKAQKAVTDYAAENGWVPVIGFIVVVVGIIMGIYYGRVFGTTDSYAEYFPRMFQSWGTWLRSKFVSAGTSISNMRDAAVALRQKSVTQTSP